MRSYFDYLISNYQQIQRSKIKSVVEEFRRVSRDYIRDIQDSDFFKTYLNIRVTYSKGRYNNLSLVPWITFTDTEITSSPRYGYYVVYLISSDFKRVYLSLNQGWEQYVRNDDLPDNPSKLEAAREKAKEYRRILGIQQNENFIFDIDLHEKKNLSVKGFVAANIASYCYDMDSLPNDDTLYSDLNEMLELYFSLASFIKAQPEKPVITAKEQKETKKHAKTNESKKTIELTEPPILRVKRDVERVRQIIGKRDYEKLARVRKKIGDIGEQMVLEHEKAKVRTYGFNEDQVKHVANNGDGDGFDIISLNEQGQQIYIEVKSTSSSKTQPFYISANEYEKFIELKDNYYIYRIYDLHTQPKWFIINYAYFSRMRKITLEYLVEFVEE